jgi:hypothetical protein
MSTASAGRPRGGERKVFSNYMDKELFSQLDEISRKTRISKARLLDKSVELLIEHYKENDGSVKYGG